MGPCIIVKASPNNKYLVRKVGTDKTKVLHRVRLCQFTARQPISVIQTTPRGKDARHKVSIKALKTMICRPRHEIVNMRSQSSITVTRMQNPNSPGITGRSKLAPDENRTIPGTMRKSSPEIFLPGT